MREIKRRARNNVNRKEILPFTDVEYDCFLTEAMTVHGMSVSDLAYITGIDQRLIRRYMNHEVIPNIHHAMKIAKALEQPVNTIWLTYIPSVDG